VHSGTLAQSSLRHTDRVSGDLVLELPASRLRATLEAAGLAGKGITVHTLRSAANSLYAARGLTINEVAEVMGQSDPQTTWKHYLRLFDRSEGRGPHSAGAGVS
jgi:integrase